jgi:hypothetical protein
VPVLVFEVLKLFIHRPAFASVSRELIHGVKAKRQQKVCPPTPSGSWLCSRRVLPQVIGHAGRTDEADSTSEIGKLGGAPKSRQLMRNDLG